MAYTITEAQAVELLKIAEELVGKHVKTGSISESDRKDYVQELMLLMVQHQDDWTVPVGVRFESFAGTVMKKRLISIWRKAHRKYDVMNSADSLNIAFTNEFGEEDEIISLLTENGFVYPGEAVTTGNGKLIAEVRLFISTLPQEEQLLCKLLMYYKPTAASRIMKKNRKTIVRLIQKIQKKMIEAGLNKILKKN